MRDFIYANEDTLKFVINYHSYGNMFLIPYGGDDQSLVLTDEQATIYEEIATEATFPAKVAMGDSEEVIKYTVNGDATDWITYATGIIAICLELANESIFSMTFDIPSVWIESAVIMENLDLPLYLTEKAGVVLELSEDYDNPGLDVDFNSGTIVAMV